MIELVDAIRHGDLHPSLPQELTLHGGEILRCEQLLRVLPGKRGVFKARYLGRDVLAKIFLDSASRQLARELTGYERLITAQQPTPPLIATVTTEGASALLFEFLSDAQPLFREDTAPGTTELQPLLDRLQSMYTRGVYHDDLHWGNFLWCRDTSFVIDAGAVMGTATQPLNSQEIIDNLGVLIAQFHRCDQDAIRAAIMVHPLCQQFQLSPKALATAAETHWRQRKKTLLEKCFRNTTAHRFASRFNHIYAYRRAYFGPELEAFLRNPDAMMASGRALKLGNSATVVKLTLDGRAVVIKRYNMKSFWHWLRRCWRPSRAWNSWRNAHWLELLGLHTPTPIAFLEMRCGFLRRRAYYVCSYNEGQVLANALAKRDPSAAELAELEKYFTVAAQEHLIHGDMKATNFLWHDTRLIILDLDAMNEIGDSRRWRTLFARDFSRFARNANIPASITTELKTLVSKLMESTIYEAE